MTVVLQLVDPPQSRRIWIGEHDGKRYEQPLQRIDSGPILHGTTAPIPDKYSYDISRDIVERGDPWMFEAAPRLGAWVHVMKTFYCYIPVPLIVTDLTTLFVPRVDDFVENALHAHLGRAAG